MVTNRYIFLDRDGTIIKDKYHMYKIEDIKFLPKAIKGLQMLQSIGYQFIVLTNQAGVARGFFSVEMAKIFHAGVERKLEKNKIFIKKTYFCFHGIDDRCECRKPKPGMAFEAAKAFGIDLSRSIFVGDKDSDIGLGKNCKGKTFLIKNSQYHISLTPDFTASNLYEVFQILKSKF